METNDLEKYMIMSNFISTSDASLIQVLEIYKDSIDVFVYHYDDGSVSIQKFDKEFIDKSDFRFIMSGNIDAAKNIIRIIFKGREND